MLVSDFYQILNCEIDFINKITVENTNVQSNLVFSNNATPRVLEIKPVENLNVCI
jgi:hypothetical protein